MTDRRHIANRATLPDDYQFGDAAPAGRELRHFLERRHWRSLHENAAEQLRRRATDRKGPPAMLTVTVHHPSTNTDEDLPGVQSIVITQGIQPVWYAIYPDESQVSHNNTVDTLKRVVSEPAAG